MNQKGSPFYIFRPCATFSEGEKFSKVSSFFSRKVLRFLSLRYSADFRGSRLVDICEVQYLLLPNSERNIVCHTFKMLFFIFEDFSLNFSLLDVSINLSLIFILIEIHFSLFKVAYSRGFSSPDNFIEKSGFLA